MEQTRETTPDELMEDFRGGSLGGILIFTVIAHAVILLIGTVVPWVWGVAFGPKVEDMEEKQRMELAVKAARASLSDIAKEYGLDSPDALSKQMAGGARPAPKPESGTPEEPKPTPPEGEGEDPKPEPESAIEKEINKVEPGPEVPPIPEDDDEDLFK